ncbi:hypothetical protein N0X72_25330 [Streptomyces carpaticus]|uniref:DUF7426 family protein n=1 Tax=Streptomyces carpaticus TaxID=285558 RepID=UPI00220B4E9B|nr:hypothetical protein N0X72_25330 [Streptomyces carpaticus]
MAFDALDDFLDESITLPIGGRTYVIPAPSAAVGLRVQAMVQAAAAAADGGRIREEVLSDAAERDHYRDVLGTAYENLLADGVSWPALKHAALTAMVWITQDRATAERFWASADPKAGAPNRAARRQQDRSGGASTTRSAGSTSGTSGRPARRRRPRDNRR